MRGENDGAEGRSATFYDPEVNGAEDARGRGSARTAVVRGGGERAHGCRERRGQRPTTGARVLTPPRASSIARGVMSGKDEASLRLSPSADLVAAAAQLIDLGPISTLSRLHLSYISAISTLHLGYISADHVAAAAQVIDAHGLAADVRFLVVSHLGDCA